MRYVNLFTTVGVLLSSGCSVMIAECGKDLGALKTREQVHGFFGKPLASGTNEGNSFEEFHTHRKLSDPVSAAGHGMGIVMSYGIGEFFAFPYELYHLGRGAFVGTDIRFTYDAAGKVTGFSFNSDHTPRLPSTDRRQPTGEKPLPTG